MSVSITLDECKAYAMGSLNGIRASEGMPDYSAAEIETWWSELTPSERVEWEDSALEHKMYTAGCH